jgi:integrase
MEDGLVTFNPAARLGRLLRGHQDRRAHIQTSHASESTGIATNAEEHYKVLYPVLLCAVRAGLRLGELIGLQWGDVDFYGRFIEVLRDGSGTTTKSHKIRRVQMSQQLHDTLERLKRATEAVRQLDSMSQGKPMEPYVFLPPRRPTAG